MDAYVDDLGLAEVAVLSVLGVHSQLDKGAERWWRVQPDAAEVAKLEEAELVEEFFARCRHMS